MRFGICTSSSRWKTVAQIGYDFAEYNLSALAKDTEEKFESMLAIQKECGIRIEACNGFFPSDFKLYATREDGTEDVEGFEQVLKNVRRYVEGVFPRAAQLGVCVTVLGSAGARTVHEGVDRSVAERQFLQILRVCADIGERYGILVTVEPLNYSETNFIHTLADGLDFARRAEHKNVGAMVDFYHHYYNKESFDAFSDAMPLLAHTHFANPTRHHLTAADIDFVTERMAILRSIGYDGRVSLECGMGDDFARAAAESFEIFKKFR